MLALMSAIGLSETAAHPPELFFRDACSSSGTRASIAAVGDLIFNARLEAQALADDGTYRQFWKPVEGFLASADLIYANLEGTVSDGIAFDGKLVAEVGRSARNSVFSAPASLLSFNYHASLLDDMKVSGFSVLSTANNHALDRGWLGIDRTIDNITRRGLASTGTRRRHEADAPWSTIVSANGLKVAWLACTYGTNGRPDFHHQVLGCYSDRAAVLDEIRRLARLDTVDAIMFVPHWGVENTDFVLLDQIELAHEAFVAGATAILGAHPHVLQHWEKLTEANGREGLVIYSLGNFISDQRARVQRIGAIARLELLKEPGSRAARLSAVGYLPTYVEIGWVHQVRELRGQERQLPLPRGNRMRLVAPKAFPRACEMHNPAD
jgi:poly-gamma-glutamate synthesis protein (capsule biosynthesis protein)